jgi:hypothetical protein
MERSWPDLLDSPLICHLSQSLSLIHWDFQSLHYCRYCLQVILILKVSLSICHDVAMFGKCLAAWLTFWIWRQILVNSNGGFWLAMDRVGVCHPEMALEMLLCQFWSFHAYDAQMHSPCCFKTSPWQLHPILGSLWRVFLYFWRQMCYSFGVRWAIPSYRPTL